MLLSLIAKAVVRKLTPRPVYLANEQEAETVYGVQYTDLDAANEVQPKPEGGWQLLASYGDWPHSKGLQRFQRQDAESIVSNHQSFANIGVKLLGVPFYVGHPDHEDFQGKPGHSDMRAYGRVKAFEARDAGLFGNVKWSRAGKEMIEDGAYHGISVNWGMRREGTSNVFRPFMLKSIGFTNNPNIPVPPILSANEKETFMDRKLLAKQLGLSENATEAEIQAKLTSMANELQAAQSTIVALKATEAEYAGKKTEFANAQQKIATLESEKNGFNVQITTLTGERDTLKTNFANERKAHSKVLLDLAQLDGRITAADRTALETEIANESTFANAVTKLGEAKKKTIPTGGSIVTGNRTRVDQSDRMDKVQSFVNAKMKEGLSYDEAFAAVQKEQSALFANMKQPEHAQ